MPVCKVKRSGSGFAVELPKRFALLAKLYAGQSVEVSLIGGQLVIRSGNVERNFSRDRYLQQLRGRQLTPHPIIKFPEDHE